MKLSALIFFYLKELHFILQMRLPPELIDLIKDFVWDKVPVGKGRFYWNRMDLFNGIDASEPEPDPWQLPMVESHF